MEKAFYHQDTDQDPDGLGKLNVRRAGLVNSITAQTKSRVVKPRVLMVS